MSVLPKKQMSEEDIKLQYITPAIQKKGGMIILQWKRQ